MRAIWALIFAGFVTGCGSAGAVQTHGGWVSDRGGIVTDARVDRVQHAADRLTAGTSSQTKVSVYVLNSPSLAAYSWPDGSIYLTRALVDRLSDDELAAVVAHEMGHLKHDTHATVAALDGASHGRSAADIETRADATGVAMLQKAGLSRSAMIRMLRKVESSSGLSRSDRAAIRFRIQLLSAAQAAAAKQTSASPEIPPSSAF